MGKTLNVEFGIITADNVEQVGFAGENPKAVGINKTFTYHRRLLSIHFI